MCGSCLRSIRRRLHWTRVSPTGLHFLLASGNNPCPAVSKHQGTTASASPTVFVHHTIAGQKEQTKWPYATVPHDVKTCRIALSTIRARAASFLFFAPSREPHRTGPSKNCMTSISSISLHCESPAKYAATTAMANTFRLEYPGDEESHQRAHCLLQPPLSKRPEHQPPPRLW